MTRNDPFSSNSRPYAQSQGGDIRIPATIVSQVFGSNTKSAFPHDSFCNDDLLLREAFPVLQLRSSMAEAKAVQDAEMTDMLVLLHHIPISLRFVARSSMLLIAKASHTSSWYYSFGGSISFAATSCLTAKME